ncbi:MAG: glycogen/starch synthase [Muribaculaceae bacterium]|nr:glycogen/starch synthase [Muribaculaceae bacterium]
MENKKLLYISQEIAPYLPESPLAVYGRDLPQKVQEKGFEVRTFMPKYGCINERRNQLHEVIRLSGMNIIIDDSDHPLIIKVATLQPSRMQVYFIDNDDYFLRAGAKELETECSPQDNDERMMFFARGIIETVKKLRWDPAVIQCTGWISTLVPMYVKRMYHDDPALAKSKIIYAIRPEKFDGTLDPRLAEKLKMLQFTDEDLAPLGSAPADYDALNRLAIAHSDAVVAATADINPELLEYAKSLSKPILEYPGDENYADKYAEFYTSLVGESE